MTSQPTFEAVVAEVLRDVVDVLAAWVQADLRKPSYMLTDADYERAAKARELVALAAELDRFLP